ncbi:MAG: cadherin domain-containing protein [Bacteroidia bacterium]
MKKFTQIIISALLLLHITNGAHAQLVYPGTVDTLTGVEMVFDFSTQGIPNDYPDAAARAFRDARGQIQMIASHYDCYRLKGSDFTTLTRDYANGPVYTSALNATYSNFNQNLWIAAPYTTDGVNIHSLVHAEFNGPTTANWHNAITYASSNDTGKTYTQVASPNHLVWALPYTYLAGSGPCGYFGPSNIVLNPTDGYYYCLIGLQDRGIQLTGTGLIRTNNLGDPLSWRGWDGTGFNATLGNPYAPGFTGPTGHTLTPLNDLNDNIGTMSESLTFNTYFNKWMLVGSSQQTINGSTVYGFFYSLSDDLIHWSFRKLIKQMPISWSQSSYPKVLYPSIIDPTDTSRNFTYSGQEVYMYYTKMNSNTDRDLVRMKIRFNKETITPTFTINSTTENTTTALDANYGDGSAISRVAGNTSVTLRSVILESNARPPYYNDSIFTVNFNIPGAGAQTISLSANLPEIKYPILFNGFSQPGAVANTASFGDQVNSTMMMNINCNNKSGFLVNGTNTTLQGLAIYNASNAAINIYDGSANQVKGCFLGMTSTGIRNATYPELNIEGIDIGGIGTDASPNNIIGGTTNVDRNVIAGGIIIRGNASTGNKIYGNYIGTDITGDTAIDRNSAGIQLYDSASYNEIGGVNANMGNLISGNDDYGIVMYGSRTSYNSVLNNYIGVKSDLQTALDNGLYSIRIYSGSHHNQIGSSAGGNVIGPASSALIIIDDSPYNTVQNNFIGTDASLTSDLGINDAAIVIDGTPSNYNTIGGTGINESNIIANSLAGIVTTNGGYSNRFLSNRFINIDEMSIDLKGDGVSNNDNLDPDPTTGAANNYLQNFPEMFDADSVAGGVRVCGELNSNINETFILQIYKSENQTASTFGAAEELIGSLNVTTASNGIVQFSTIINTPVNSGDYISVSATDSSGNTSEIGENWMIGNGSNLNPTFIWLSATSIPENSAMGTVIGTFTGQDPDLCDTHTFALASGSQSQGNSSFQIVGNELRVNGSYNFEIQNNYNLRVRCTDQSGGYYEKAWPITISNVNEAPTSLNLTGNTVSENQPIGTNVGLFSSVDPDAGATTFTYSLVSGINSQHNSSFSIVNNQLKTAAILDADTTPQLFIRVRTTDAGGLYYENMFTVGVTGINEPPTGVTASSNSIPENLPSNSTVAVLDAVDPDVNDTHIFTLVSGTGSTNNNLFTVQGSNLRASAPFDFETATPLSIRVRTVDSQSQAFEEVIVLTVSNVNEAPTNLAMLVNTTNENQSIGTMVSSVSSTDVDAGDSHTYTLVTGAGSTNNTSFTISNGQLLTAAVLDYEITPTMSIRIRTTDAGGLSYEKTQTIILQNTNDAPTAITLSANAINENQTSGTTIGNITNTDQDVVDTHTYSLVSGSGDTHNALFTINTTQLLSASNFDFETQPSLSIRLRVTDSQGAMYESIKSIQVNNINETPLTMSINHDTISENLPAGTLVANLTATDTDANDTHTYQFTTGPGSTDNGSFTISGSTLLTAQPFDFETQSLYSIRIRTTDAGGLSIDSAYSISIIDVNESVSSILEANTSVGFEIAPNPAQENVSIHSTTKMDVIRIYNGLGELVYDEKLNDMHQTNIPCKNYARGMYTVLIIDSNNNQYFRKVVLN